MNDNKKLLKDHINSEGMITVYRGMTDNINDEFGLSWSVSYDVARFFATRKGSGQIMTGIANINDVLVYNSNVHEEEVVILPESVKIISVENSVYDYEFFKKWEQDNKEFDKQMNDFIKKMEDIGVG